MFLGQALMEALDHQLQQEAVSFRLKEGEEVCQRLKAFALWLREQRKQEQVSAQPEPEPETRVVLQQPQRRPEPEQPEPSRSAFTRTESGHRVVRCKRCGAGMAVSDIDAHVCGGRRRSRRATKSGYMTKMGGFRHNWLRRCAHHSIRAWFDQGWSRVMTWFLLGTGFAIEGSSLVYYERAGEAHDTRKGEVRTTLAIWSGDAGHGYQAK